MENYKEGGEDDVTSVFRVQFIFCLKYSINNHLCYYQIAKKKILL